MTLFTIGYEDYQIDSFISYIKENSITYIIDVREMPISRKKGFSKTSLSEKLAYESIDYVHFKELGSPKHIRDKLKADHDYNFFFHEMELLLDQKKSILCKINNLLPEHNCCLLCFEKLAAECHRKLVARKVKQLNGNGLKIRNI